MARLVPVLDEKQCAELLELSGWPDTHQKTHPAKSNGEAGLRWIRPLVPSTEVSSVLVDAMMIYRHLE